MTPDFANSVDPIFLHVLGLLDRIGQGENPDVRTERLALHNWIDRADRASGDSAQWRLAKYALASWIDEVLISAPWDGREWWKNNALEYELFGTAVCYHEFYAKSQESAALPERDALEVFYVCVILGFRGHYGSVTDSAPLTQSRELAQDLQGWLEQTAKSIDPRRGRPVIADAGASGEGAPPLEGQSLFIWSLLAGLALTACLVVLFTSWLLIGGSRGPSA